MAEMNQRRERHPLVLRWHEPGDPLPRRVIRSTGPHRLLSWYESAAEGTPVRADPFDFSIHLQRLVMDIASRCSEFRHLEVPRILVSVTQARGHFKHGLQARVTPLRFPNGEIIRRRRGVPFQIQRFFLGDHEYLYLMTFVLPRFLDQDFDQKMVTLFHELYHMGPAFNGALRRHSGRYHMHSHSQRDYDEQMVGFARAYLAGKPDPSLHGFLRLNFAQLQQRYGAVTGIVVPRPKMIPLIEPYGNAARTTPGDQAASGER